MFQAYAPDADNPYSDQSNAGTGVELQSPSSSAPPPYSAYSGSENSNNPLTGAGVPANSGYPYYSNNTGAWAAAYSVEQGYNAVSAAENPYGNYPIHEQQNAKQDNVEGQIAAPVPVIAAPLPPDAGLEPAVFARNAGARVNADKSCCWLAPLNICSGYIFTICWMVMIWAGLTCGIIACVLLLSDYPEFRQSAESWNVVPYTAILPVKYDIPCDNGWMDLGPRATMRGGTKVERRKIIDYHTRGWRQVRFCGKPDPLYKTGITRQMHNYDSITGVAFCPVGYVNCGIGTGCIPASASCPITNMEVVAGLDPLVPADQQWTTNDNLTFSLRTYRGATLSPSATPLVWLAMNSRNPAAEIAGGMCIGYVPGASLDSVCPVMDYRYKRFHIYDAPETANVTNPVGPFHRFLFDQLNAPERSYRQSAADLAVASHFGEVIWYDNTCPVSRKKFYDVSFSFITYEPLTIVAISVGSIMFCFVFGYTLVYWIQQDDGVEPSSCTRSYFLLTWVVVIIGLPALWAPVSFIAQQAQTIRDVASAGTLCTDNSTTVALGKFLRKVDDTLILLLMHALTYSVPFVYYLYGNIRYRCCNCEEKGYED